MRYLTRVSRASLGNANTTLQLRSGDQSQRGSQGNTHANQIEKRSQDRSFRTAP